MFVNVYNQDQACELEPIEGTAMVSITSPGQPAPLKEGWDPLLRVEFHDIVIPRAEMPVLVDPISGGVVLFDEEIAEQIDAFCWKHKRLNFIIHCAAGQSRSVAVAMFLKDIYKAEVILHAVKTTAGANALVHRTLMRKYWEERLTT